MQKLKDRYPMTAMAYRALVAGVPVAQGLGKVGEKRGGGGKLVLVFTHGGESP